MPSSLRRDVDSRIRENGTSHVWVALSGGFDGMCLSWLRGFNSVVGDVPFLFYFIVLFIFLFSFHSFIFIALFPLPRFSFIYSRSYFVVSQCHSDRGPLPRGPLHPPFPMSRGKPKEKEAVQGVEKVTAVVVATRRGLRT